MKFKSVVTPRRVEVDEATLTNYYGRFTIEPLERGFGTTIGNSMRRVLLSSLQGAAITCVRIDGVLQEVSAIPGIAEDVTDIILNLKELVFRVRGNAPVTLRLLASGEGRVTGANIQPHPDVELLNPEQHIATLDQDATLSAELLVDVGRGYVPADRHRLPESAFNAIPVDSVFSPVRRVKYYVEDRRVEDITDYDRLIIEVWTNGTVRPDDALSYAGRILREHVLLFINFQEDEEQPRVEAESMEEVNPQLFKSVDELELSVRAYNCLRAANLRTIAQLTQKTESEMLKYRNFGRKSLTEIKEVLHKMGLGLGMKHSHPDVLAFIERADREATAELESVDNR